MLDILKIEQFTWSSDLKDVESFGPYKKYDSFSFESKEDLLEKGFLEGIIVAIGLEEVDGKTVIVLQVVVDIRSTYLIRIKE